MPLKNEYNFDAFYEKLWQTIEKYKENIELAEYKNIVLGLVFFRHVSIIFNNHHSQLKNQTDEGRDPEDPSEYFNSNVFWLSPETRWQYLELYCDQPHFGYLLDKSMEIISHQNTSLKGILPNGYSSAYLNTHCLGDLFKMIGSIKIDENSAQDTLGKIYEYFLSKFALGEGKRGGEYYTPRSIVKLLVSILEPLKGTVYDPCCGSGGIFVQSQEFINAHAGNLEDLSIYAQESNYTSYRLAKMNLAMRQMKAQIFHGDTFQNDYYPDLKFDYIMANPPFNINNWGGAHLSQDKRWTYGIPPINNSNYAWIQHIIYHLSPTGTAAFLLANGSMSNTHTTEKHIRKKIVEDNLVDCIIALPSHLFYATPIQSCIWCMSKRKKNEKLCTRLDDVLFIDGRNLGTMVDRTHRKLTDDDIFLISNVYHIWRAQEDEYKDVLGFSKSVKLDEIREKKYILSPGRYVGLINDDKETEKFSEKIRYLSSEFREQLTEMYRLDSLIQRNLQEFQYEK